MKKLPRSIGDVGLLLLRVSIGSMMLLGHGLPKLLDFSEKAAHFPDPLGVGSTVSLSLALLGEALAPLLIIVGLATRVAALPLVITMLVAAFVFHADDPWSRKELAVAYALPALALVFTGAGRFSLDRLIWKGKSDVAGAGSADGDDAAVMAKPVDGE